MCLILQLKGVNLEATGLTGTLPSTWNNFTQVSGNLLHNVSLLSAYSQDDMHAISAPWVT